jgi:hypothetical protein
MDFKAVTLAVCSTTGEENAGELRVESCGITPTKFNFGAREVLKIFLSIA